MNLNAFSIYQEIISWINGRLSACCSDIHILRDLFEKTIRYVLISFKNILL